MAKNSKDTIESGVSDDPVIDSSAEAENIKAEQKTAKESVQVLHVVAKREGFRRAGRAFGSESTRLVVSELTDEQITQLKGEPMLVVTEATEEI